MEYKLVNPYIEGKFKTIFSGNSQIDAAHNAWKSLSSYFMNNIPKFAFTLERVSDGKYHHFLVNEYINKKNVVNYKISEFNISNKKDEEVLRKKIELIHKNKNNNNNNNNISGGRQKRYEDDEDEDDDEFLEDTDTDLYRRIKYQRMIQQAQPILYWFYVPYIYRVYLNTFYVPTFITPLTPYIEIANIIIE